MQGEILLVNFNNNAHSQTKYQLGMTSNWIIRSDLNQIRYLRKS